MKKRMERFGMVQKQEANTQIQSRVERFGKVEPEKAKRLKMFQ